MPVPQGTTEQTPDRVNVYIDGSNLYHSLSSRTGRTDLDFLAFARKLAGDRRFQRAYYYSAPIDQFRQPELYRAQQRFFHKLRRTDYLELKLGTLVYRDWPASPPYEKGVDIKIATDMLVHASRGAYNAAILVSADTDFCDALQAVKDFGRHAEVALFSPTGSRALREVADRVALVDEAFLADCWET